MASFWYLKQQFNGLSKGGTPHENTAASISLALKGLAEFNESFEAILKYKPITLNHILPIFLDGRDFVSFAIDRQRYALPSRG